MDEEHALAAYESFFPLPLGTATKARPPTPLWDMDSPVGYEPPEARVARRLPPPADLATATLQEICANLPELLAWCKDWGFTKPQHHT